MTSAGQIGFATVLLPLDAFAPKGATMELMAEADRAITEIERQRPLPEHIGRKLSEDLLADRIYSSAVTEGNRLSRRETIALLTAGIVEAGSRKDITEIRNLGEAVLYLDEVVANSVETSEGLIRELHKITMRDFDALEPGAYRKDQNAIAGSDTVPPPPGDVPDLVRLIAQTIGSSLAQEHPIVLSAWAHWAVTRVHPFRDGNGRVARLVQDYILLRRHYVPIPLFPEDRQAPYYDSLEAADSGDTASLVELLTKNVLRVADRYLAAIRESSLKADWLEKIARVAGEKIRETEYRRFVAWERRMKGLKNEFEDIASELTTRIPGLQVRVRDYGGLDFEKYKALRSTGHAERTWAFGVEFKHEDVRLRFVFWVGVHFERGGDPEADMTEDPVLLVSMEERNQVREMGALQSGMSEQRITYQKLDDLEEPMITIREIINRKDGPARRRFNPVARSDEWDYAISPGQVARDFFTEVLRKLLLV